MRKSRKHTLPRQSKGQPTQPQPPKLDALAQINHHAAGLDIGDAEIYAAVPESAADPAVRVFGTFTTDLQALADWLAACQVDTVAMESTGVYWIPIYELLEERGFQVYLVNARQLKNVSGKKTDILDCQWIQQLHTYGLLQPSFRPPEDICALRALIRHRANLLRSCAAEIQHMQKALQQMNLKLTNVLSDITGLTGLAIIRDIVAGERDPHKLARHRDPHCRKSEAEIAAALTGNYKAEHLFVLKQALAAHDFYQEQLVACDAETERMYQALATQVDPVAQPLPPPRRPHSRRRNEPRFDLRTELYRTAGVDLTTVDGLDVLTVQAVLTETGVDTPALAAAPQRRCKCDALAHQQALRLLVGLVSRKRQDRRQDHQARDQAGRQSGRPGPARGSAQFASQRQRSRRLLPADVQQARQAAGGDGHGPQVLS